MKISSAYSSLVAPLLYLLLGLGLQGCLKQTYDIDACNTRTILHTDPISAQTQLITTALNTLLLSGVAIDWLEYDSTKTQFIEPTDELKQNFTVSTQLVTGRQVVTIAPKSGASGTYILYMHGGGYAKNIDNTYYPFLSDIINNTGATMILPDYGVAPYHTYREGYALMQQVYTSLVARVGAANVILMGDSAGGGFALGFTQKLKLEQQPMPRQVILISPWLDIALTSPDIKNLNVGNLNKIRAAGIAWAGGTDLSFYQLSPLNGPLTGLPPVSVFIGGRDFLLADAMKLRKKMSASCSALAVYEYPQLFHVWMLAAPKLPESKKATAEIFNLIKG